MNLNTIFNSVSKSSHIVEIDRRIVRLYIYYALLLPLELDS